MKKLFCILVVVFASATIVCAQTTKSKEKQHGYKGFVDVGYTVGVGKVEEGRAEISTTHGYLINPYIFVGGGLGIHYMHKMEKVEIPVFANARTYFMKGDIKPFFDIKLGYTICDLIGFYAAPSVGVSIKKFDFSVGYSAQLLELQSTVDGSDAGSLNCGGISFKFGVNF